MNLSLGALCFPANRSRGRRYPELPHPYRTDFQRDRDRIIHARAFRRMEDKTQVFAPGLCDHFRNRLTHTLEVAQIARTVAGVLQLEQDLTEALALAHDVGHPPFAHAGEQELNRLMQQHGGSFDHNQHALRMLESFEQCYARFPGLNLTFEVREGLVKHSRDFAPGEIPALQEYLPGLRPPLEAQLIDLTDEIAYNTADLDDAYAAGLLLIEEVCQEIPACAELWEHMEMQYPGASEKIRVQETVRTLVNQLVSGLIQGTFDAVRKAGVHSSEDVRAYQERLVRFTPETQQLNGQLKRFLRRCVYGQTALVQERQRRAAQLRELFALFLAEPERLPAAYQEEATEEPLPRVVCDYIAGMTDGYFQRIYERHFTLHA